MQFKLLRITAALTGTWLLAGPAQAQPGPATLDTITVIGSRTPQAADQVLGDVSIIDREAIERAGHSSLAGLLSSVAGIEAVDYGGPQTNTSLFLRGSNSNQTLVLVDGLRINSATSGGGALNALALNDIERIEVLRGAAGSLYGADAVGGVINIITRQGADRPLAPWFSVGYGSRDTSRVEAGVAGSANGWRYALNAGYGQSRGHNATEPGSFSYNPDRDGYYQRNMSASVGYTWCPGHELSAQAYYSRVNGAYDNGTPYFNDRGIQQVEGYALTSRNRLSANWHSTLRLGTTRDRGTNKNAPAALMYGNPEDGVSRFSTRQNQYSWQNDFQLAEHQRLTLLLERLEQRVAGDLSDWSGPAPVYVDYVDTRRDTNSATGIYTGDFGRHHLQASLRHDKDTQYGGQTTGALAYGFDLTPRLRATVSGSTAFRAPNFNELYYPGGGNPDLRPEKSRNIEAGIRYLHAGTELGATVYRNRVRDLINGWPAENIGNAVLKGVTLQAAQQFGATGVRASLDLQDPHDADTGERLALRAGRILRVAADHRIGAVQFGADWYVSGHRYASGTGERLGGYGRLDLVASYDLTPETRLQVRWNNALDKDYTLLPGYYTAGSSVFVSLAYRPR